MRPTPVRMYIENLFRNLFKAAKTEFISIKINIGNKTNEQPCKNTLKVYAALQTNPLSMKITSCHGKTSKTVENNKNKKRATAKPNHH